MAQSNKLLRPTWPETLLNMIRIIKLRATCLRLLVGCIIWNPITKQIISIGYNGSPKGEEHCLDVGCDMEDSHCVRCLHGEDNALLWAGQEARGSWMFLEYTPCRRCLNKIIQSGISVLVYERPYGIDWRSNLKRLQSAGIVCFNYSTDKKLCDDYLRLLS